MTFKQLEKEISKNGSSGVVFYPANKNSKRYKSKRDLGIAEAWSVKSIREIFKKFDNTN